MAGKKGVKPFHLNKEKINELYNSGMSVKDIRNTEWGKNPRNGKPAAHGTIVSYIDNYVSPLPSFDKEEIIRLYKEGYSCEQIANMPVGINSKTGKPCNSSTIFNIIKDISRKKRFKVKDEQILIDMYKSGCTIEEILASPHALNLNSHDGKNISEWCLWIILGDFRKTNNYVDQEELRRLHFEERIPQFELLKHPAAISKATGRPISDETLSKILGEERWASKKTLTKEDIDYNFVMEKFNDGWSLTKIAEEIINPNTGVKMNPITLRDIMGDDFIPSGDVSEEDVELIHKLHIEEKMTPCQIAKLNFISKRSGKPITSSRIETILADNYDDSIYAKKSSLEETIKLLFNQYGIDFHKNNRRAIKPLELDFYIEKANLAIEVNGNYWHGEHRKPKMYHFDKYQSCISKGIELLQFKEEDVMYKQDIVFSIIKNKLGIISEKIPARKCIIKGVEKNEEKKFLDENHIQGFSSSSVCYGLYFNNVLVYIMSFRKPRFNTKHEWEIIRTCTKKDTNVIGGASKLFKHFVKSIHPKSILSYANLYYGSGKIYEKLGFSLSHFSEPNYIWFRGFYHPYYNRYQTQKHKLKKLFPDTYSDDKTEVEIMKENKYYRIYDAGNAVYTWQNPNPML